MNSFISDLDKDMSRGLFISSHRSLLGLIQYVTSTGNFVDDTESRFFEVIMNGTVNGITQGIVENTTFTDWQQKMQEQGRKINIDLNFAVHSITIEQTSPWQVMAELNISTIIADTTGAASWNRSSIIQARLDVMGFEDPLYAVHTQGKVLNVINRTPFTDFVDLGEQPEDADTTNLLQHATNSYYVAWETGPSFLMRFEGNLSSSSYGIESLINLDKLELEGITTQPRSVVDHIYWSNKSVTSYTVQNMPSWFRMDDEYNSVPDQTHLEFYEVDTLI